MKSKNLIIAAALTLNFAFAVLNSTAQNVGINTSGAIANVSALLDIDAAPGNNKGLLIPRIALVSSFDATTIVTPAYSLLVYNLGTGGLSPAGYYYNSGSSVAPLWVQLLSAGTSFCSTATTNFVTKFTGSSSICNSIIYDNGTNIGINTTTPVVSVQINATDAIAIPTGTTAQEPAGAPVGSLRFNTTLGVLEVFNGTCWQNSNTPPIGSTYVQWFNAADPNSLYPCTVWVASDIVNGEFIRAVGGLSNVPSAPLTGVVQSFATQDHTHFSSGTVGNSGTLTTSSDGLHNHGGITSGVSSGNGMWFPFDDNLSSNAGNPGDFGNSATSTCGIPWDGRPTAGNFMGQFGDLCMAHEHLINSDGLHFHTIPPHTHPLTISVGNMSSGNIANETRPTNVAVIFWRRTQ